MNKNLTEIPLYGGENLISGMRNFIAQFSNDKLSEDQLLDKINA